MINEQDAASRQDESDGSPVASIESAAGPNVQEVKVNNRALLAQYVEAATLAQARLLAYLSGVLGERGVEGQIRGWDVARGVIIVSPEPDGGGAPK